MPPHTLGRYAFLVGGAWLAGAFAGCAVLPWGEIPVENALQAGEGEVAKVSIHPGRPVLLRAVDEKVLPAIQVSNVLRPLTYVLRAGQHVLWLSETPAGIPFLPQRISCHVMQVHLIAGTSYTLELDPRVVLPALRRAGTEEPDAVGVVVDRPLLIDRGCRWQ